MKTKMLIAVLIVLAACCATPAWAQFTNVKGKVTEKDGTPIVGATIVFTNTDRGRKYELKSDSRGEFVSSTIPIGNYTIDATYKDGKTISHIEGARVQATNESAGINGNEFPIVAGTGAGLSKKDIEKQNAEVAAKNAKEAELVNNLNGTIKAAREAEAKADFGEAIRMLTQATQTDATRDVLWAELGVAHLGAGKKANTAGDRAGAKKDFEGAVDALQKAIEIKSSIATYHSLLGQAYSRLGKLPETKTEYELAVENDPANAAKYYFNIGAAMTNAGNTKEANEAFDKTIAADPNYAEAYYQKGLNLMAYAKVDEKTGATIAPPEVSANLQKYLELAPKGPNAQAAQEILTQLGQKVQTSFSTRPAKGTKKK